MAQSNSNMTHDADSADNVRVGESPVPGLTLKYILRGHTDSINRIAWSPDGKFLASPSADGTVRIWDLSRGECKMVLEGHLGYVMSVVWSPDGQCLASASYDHTIRLWDAVSGKCLRTLEGHKSGVERVVWSPDGQHLASACRDTICLWDAVSGKPLHNLERHNGNVWTVAWSPNSQIIASGANDDTLRLWDGKSGKLLKTHILKSCGMYLQWLNNESIAIAHINGTISIWDIPAEQQKKIIEGHTHSVMSISLSPNNRLLASKSWDHTVRIWSTDSWAELAVLPETSNLRSNWFGIAMHPHLPCLATLGEKDKVIRIWDLDIDTLLGQSVVDSVSYTTAKLVLVGDSGVGKTGLGWRLAHREFKEHASTHGQQFWVIDDLGETRDDGTECEAVLWDLAGQPDYRLVHSLFLDDVDMALVLFDPTDRQEPLAGVAFWINQLKNKEQDLCRCVLVGARIDRGISTLTVEELQAYCEQNGICGGYIPTSALEGEGLQDLLACLKDQIPWDEMTTTITTQTFKLIKEYVLGMKEQAERKHVLVQPDELRSQLQATDSDWNFSDDEMMTAVGHLATHGYVTVLQGSQGTKSILLEPDLLANLAASIVLEARRNQHGLGVLEESRLLAGEYNFPELRELDEDECEILLDAADVIFLEHNLCFRETFNRQTFLIFPSLINEKRPKTEDLTPVEGASYRVQGAVENVYASLVVLLGYTNTFIRTHQWQNQAQYEMGEGEICGFQQTIYGSGEIELVLCYAEDTPEPVKLTFRGLCERFLSRRNLEISRYQPVICGACGGQLARNVVMSQLAKNKDFSFCSECGEKLSLHKPEALTRLSRQEELALDLLQAVVERRTAFEAALVRVKALLRDRGKEEHPTCFISYAWGVPEHERWVLQLAKDLRNTGIDVLLDRWHSPPGSNLDLYIDRILSCDYVLPVGTPELRQKYDTQKTNPIVAAELKLINLRVRQPSEYGDTVLPVLLSGEAQVSLSPQLQPLVSVDFREEPFYFRNLFGMIWRIYNLPFDHPLLEELQDSMSPRKNELNSGRF